MLAPSWHTQLLQPKSCPSHPPFRPPTCTRDRAHLLAGDGVLGQVLDAAKRHRADGVHRLGRVGDRGRGGRLQPSAAAGALPARLRSSALVPAGAGGVKGGGALHHLRGAAQRGGEGGGLRSWGRGRGPRRRGGAQPGGADCGGRAHHPGGRATVVPCAWLCRLPRLARRSSAAARTRLADPPCSVKAPQPRPHRGSPSARCAARCCAA